MAVTICGHILFVKYVLDYGENMPSDDWIDIVLRRANELRAAGVLSIQVDGCGATLAAYDPRTEPVKTEAPEEEQVYRNPLHDPATYGGDVPGFTITPLVEID